jgi:OmpA-OmpF porin, OOP family
VATVISRRVVNIARTSWAAAFVTLHSFRYAQRLAGALVERSKGAGSMRLRSIILALVLCIICVAARAQPIQGIYIGGGAGLRAPFPTKTTSLTPGLFGNDFDIREALGYDGQLSVGYALGDGWRFELEGTYGRSNIFAVTGTPFPATASGSIQNWGLMTNALFDMDVGSPYIYPYLGLGVGYQSTHLNGFVLSQTNRPFSFSAGGDDGGFAAQVIGGASFPIPNMPGLSITLDYRIIDILGGAKFSGVSSFGAGGPPLAGEMKFHNQFNQAVMLGVRYAFNAPPPAAAANQAASPAPSPSSPIQTYQVFFGLNKATLTDRDFAIVKDAAMASTKNQTTRIEVTGYTDTSGNAAANQALSERRAKAVAAALARDGVAKDEITVRARADSNLAVPTGPDVAEPRNRRVEIVLQ